MAKNYNDKPLLKDRVKELIEKRNTTQVKLAEYLEITPRSLNRILHDGWISFDSLIKVSSFLDCNPYYLIDETVGYTPFAAYEEYKYDYDDCLKGLLHKHTYKLSDFSESEFQELMHLIDQIIDIYAALHLKKPYDKAFWTPGDDGEIIANIIFNKKEGDAE